MDRVDERLAELAAQWELPSAAPAQLRSVLEDVAAEPTSITTVRDPVDGVDVHVADALSGLAVGWFRSAERIADLGSGGGFPGLALAAALPGATVTLVESVGKKCAFLDRAAAAAGLANVVVVNARAEEWRAGLGTQDLVTARALAPLNVLLEYAAPLLHVRGALIAWKAALDPEEQRDAEAAARTLGMEARDTVAVTPFADAGERFLHLYLKVAETPSRYPRRAGMARKRPIRAST